MAGTCACGLKTMASLTITTGPGACGDDITWNSPPVHWWELCYSATVLEDLCKPLYYKTNVDRLGALKIGILSVVGVNMRFTDQVKC